MPADHPNRADILTVAGWGGYSGYDDGTFRPNRTITAEQMARVLGRVFEDGMSRGDFASFMVGGKARMESATTTTTTTTVPGDNYYARTYWPNTNRVGCSGMWDDMVAAHENWTYSDPGARPFDPREVDDFATQRRLGISYGDSVFVVRGWYKRFVTETFFVCQGRAKFNNGAQATILIYTLVDSDGDAFWGVFYPVSNDTSCSAARRAGASVWAYNRGFIYDSQRDSDNDRIMCEGVLPEDSTGVVGDPPAGRVAL